MKKNRLIFISVIFLIGLVSTSVIGVDLFQENREQVKVINQLKAQLNRMENNTRNQTKDLKMLDFLKYRDTVVRKKYPVFSKIVDVVYNKSKEYGFNPNLVLSLIQTESNFRPQAVSSRGAYGLMQVNYTVWKDELDINSTQIFDIEYNIDLGLQILKRYHEKSGGDLLKTLHLYNNGYLHDNQKYKYKVVSSVFY